MVKTVGTEMTGIRAAKEKEKEESEKFVFFIRGPRVKFQPR